MGIFDATVTNGIVTGSTIVQDGLYLNVSQNSNLSDIDVDSDVNSNNLVGVTG